MNRALEFIMASGLVLPFAGSVAPTGWLMCHGQAVSRSEYPALFAVIGTTYGPGDGTTTFNVPDLRGEFIRGLDAGRGIDAGRTLGSTQDDAFQGHFHENSGQESTTFGGAGVGSRVFRGTDGTTLDLIKDPMADGQNGTPRTASETRPRNVALNHLIKT